MCRLKLMSRYPVYPPGIFYWFPPAARRENRREKRREARQRWRSDGALRIFAGQRRGVTASQHRAELRRRARARTEAGAEMYAKALEAEENDECFYPINYSANIVIVIYPVIYR